MVKQETQPKRYYCLTVRYVVCPFQGHQDFFLVQIFAMTSVTKCTKKNQKGLKLAFLDYSHMGTIIYWYKAAGNDRDPSTTTQGVQSWQILNFQPY